MILLDSGISHNKDLGDNALLEKTIEKLGDQPYEVLEADIPFFPRQKRLYRILEFLNKILRCRKYYVVVGGIFHNSSGRRYLGRRFLAIALIRLLGKPVIVDTQTVYLRGSWRLLFKMLFRGLTVPARDLYTYRELQQLNVATYIKGDPLIENCNSTKSKSGNHQLIVIDRRFQFRSYKLVDKMLEVLDEVKGSKVRIRYVPTINTDLHWRTMEKCFGNADIALCCSFHAAIFALNQGAETYCFYDTEVYRRKFSVLENAIKIDVRRSA